MLEATDQPCGVLGSMLGSRGDVGHMLSIDAGGAAKPATAETVAAGEHFITMRGNEIFKFAVRSMAKAATKALAKAGLTAADLQMVIPHQANLRIVKATQKELGLPDDKVFINVDRYGNTGAASIPIALCELLAAETVQPGDNLMLVAFGGGLTWAASVVRWADVKAITGTRAARPFVVSAVAGEASLAPAP